MGVYGHLTVSQPQATARSRVLASNKLLKESPLKFRGDAGPRILDAYL